MKASYYIVNYELEKRGGVTQADRHTKKLLMGIVSIKSVLYVRVFVYFNLVES